MRLGDGIRRRLENGASLVVGVGVLGTQAARTGAEDLVARVADRVRPVVGDLAGRLEPLLERVPGRGHARRDDPGGEARAGA